MKASVKREPRRRQKQQRRRLEETRVSSRRGTNDVWLDDWRTNALADFAVKVRGLTWTRTLFLSLLDELRVGDDFEVIIGSPTRLAPARYPEAVAVAIALRRSWRPEDLAAVTASLCLPVGDDGASARPRA